MSAFLNLKHFSTSSSKVTWHLSRPVQELRWPWGLHATAPSSPHCFSQSNSAILHIAVPGKISFVVAKDFEKAGFQPRGIWKSFPRTLSLPSFFLCSFFLIVLSTGMTASALRHPWLPHCPPPQVLPRLLFCLYLPLPNLLGLLPLSSEFSPHPGP